MFRYLDFLYFFNKKNNKFFLKKINSIEFLNCIKKYQGKSGVLLKIDIESSEYEIIDFCKYCKSLMGNNLKEYLVEGKKVLRYNGEIIISESSERYENIKNYLTELDMKIINEEYDKNKRWFYINVIKQ